MKRPGALAYGGSFEFHGEEAYTEASRTRFEVETHEKHRGIAISRNWTLWLGSNAFDFDRCCARRRRSPDRPVPIAAPRRRIAEPAT
jgi:hypothetical protein